jgi:hypothetical protein
VELGSTPGVFICVRCALWAARRAGPGAALRQLRSAVGSLLHRLQSTAAGPGARAGIPILPSADLGRTAAFYTAAGFTETGRYETYLLVQIDGVEVHFSLQDTPVPGQCFIHVGDALAVWKQLRHDGADGVSAVEDKDYGLREFVLTDPDGNQVRFGSPLH